MSQLCTGSSCGRIFGLRHQGSLLIRRGVDQMSVLGIIIERREVGFIRRSNNARPTDDTPCGYLDFISILANTRISGSRW